MLATGVRSFLDNDLLSYASALAFRILFALVPLLLAGLALVGFLGLDETWKSDLGPRVRDAVQPDAFSVIDRTVKEILGEKRFLWLTFGVAFALWQVGAAVRTLMAPLNRVYGLEEERPGWRRLATSLLVAVPIAALVVGAALVIQLGPRILRSVHLPALLELVLYVARWGLAVAMLVLAVSLLIRYAPAKPQSFAWAGVGSVLVIGSWLLASVGFGLYATFVADYRSAYGSLASAIVLLTYLFVSCVALFFGLQVDGCVRGEVEEESAERREGGDRDQRPRRKKATAAAG